MPDNDQLTGKLSLNAEAKANKTNDLAEGESRTGLIEIAWPTTVKEAETAWGDKVVVSLCSRQAKVDAQGTMRRLLEKGNTEDQIMAYFENVNYDSEDPNAPEQPWRPGLAPTKKSSMEKLLDTAGDFTPEELQRFMEQLKKRKAEKVS